jgi:hypothetical protein
MHACTHASIAELYGTDDIPCALPKRILGGGTHVRCISQGSMFVLCVTLQQVNFKFSPTADVYAYTLSVSEAANVRGIYWTHYTCMHTLTPRLLMALDHYSAIIRFFRCFAKQHCMHSSGATGPAACSSYLHLLHPARMPSHVQSPACCAGFMAPSHCMVGSCHSTCHSTCSPLVGAVCLATMRALSLWQPPPTVQRAAALAPPVPPSLQAWQRHWGDRCVL